MTLLGDKCRESLRAGSYHKDTTGLLSGSGAPGAAQQGLIMVSEARQKEQSPSTARIFSGRGRSWRRAPIFRWARRQGGRLQAALIGGAFVALSFIVQAQEPPLPSSATAPASGSYGGSSSSSFGVPSPPPSPTTIIEPPLQIGRAHV